MQTFALGSSIALLCFAAACDGLPASPLDGGVPTDSSFAADANNGVIGGDRPVSVHVPPGYVPGTPTPLVVMLHGYTASGDLEEVYLQLTPLADSRGFLYAHPDGTVDLANQHFWNATDACCNLNGSTVDDSTYLSTVIKQISAKYSVDPKRVYLVGHSNGGFMSHRMACDHADQIAAIASLAGAQWNDLAKCKPTVPVSVLQIHGTADAVIAYNGGVIGVNGYPGAVTTANDWVGLDRCATTADTSSAPLDLDSVLLGAETAVSKWSSGCSAGGHVELWTIQGGSHIPTLSPTFSSSVVDFLLAHPKP